MQCRIQLVFWCANLQVTSNQSSSVMIFFPPLISRCFSYRFHDDLCNHSLSYIFWKRKIVILSNGFAWFMFTMNKLIPVILDKYKEHASNSSKYVHIFLIRNTWPANSYWVDVANPWPCFPTRTVYTLSILVNIACNCLHSDLVLTQKLLFVKVFQSWTLRSHNLVTYLWSEEGKHEKSQVLSTVEAEGSSGVNLSLICHQIYMFCAAKLKEFSHMTASCTLENTKLQ